MADHLCALLACDTPQTQQRLFFSFCDHSGSSFAIENNWVRPHPPERSSKIGIWIEKFRCQNSNLNLPTIKNGFYGYSYLKDLLRILKRICAQFWNPWVIPVIWVCLDIVIQRKTHGEPFLYVKSSIRIRGAIFSMLWLQRCCEKAATNNWVRPHSFKRSSKTEPEKQKFQCQNSNLNFPTNKKTVI